MNLFYQPEIQRGITHLDAEESRHAIRVLRMTKGTEFQLTDGKGFLYLVKITKPDSRKCEFEILERQETTQRNFFIHIAIAPTKNSDRIEWFVEKATEIGIDEITFLFCKNSERKTINVDRVKRMAVSALKQSQQARLPKINDIIPFKKILDSATDQKFIAFVDFANPRKPLQSIIQQHKKYLVLIGPEGDFSKEELQSASHQGFEKVSLGPNRMRTETAGLVAVQILALANE